MDEFAVKKKDIYKTSRLMYIFEACFEYLVSIMLGGVYLAKLTQTLGISDGVTAILSTVASLAAIFQVFSIMLARKRPYKRWVIPAEIVTQSMLGMLYIIPFLKIDSTSASVIFFIIMFCGFAVKSIITPIKCNWFISLASSRRRGLFQSVISGFSIFGQIFMELIMSHVIDRYEAKGNIKGAFIVITILIFAFTGLNLIFLLCSREKPQEKEEEQDRKSHLAADIKVILKNKLYVRFVILNIIVTVCTALYTPFLGTYQISELDFSMQTVAIIQTCRSIGQICLLAIFGRLSVKYHYIHFMKFGYTVKVLAILMIVFTNPENGLLMFSLYSTLDVISAGGTCVSGTAIYSIASKKERVTAISVNAIIVGVISFLTTLITTPLFNYIKEVKGSQLFGRTVYAQQALAAIAFVFGLILLIYIFFVFAKTVKREENSISDDEEE